MVINYLLNILLMQYCSVQRVEKPSPKPIYNFEVFNRQVLIINGLTLFEKYYQRRIEKSGVTVSE
jgi:hypothetical protein